MTLRRTAALIATTAAATVLQKFGTRPNSRVRHAVHHFSFRFAGRFLGAFSGVHFLAVLGAYAILHDSDDIVYDGTVFTIEFHLLLLYVAVTAAQCDNLRIKQKLL